MVWSKSTAHPCRSLFASPLNRCKKSTQNTHLQPQRGANASKHRPTSTRKAMATRRETRAATNDLKRFPWEVGRCCHPWNSLYHLSRPNSQKEALKDRKKKRRTKEGKGRHRKQKGSRPNHQTTEAWSSPDAGLGPHLG